jgi:Zn/Cd-binding protein ZinT
MTKLQRGSIKKLKKNLDQDWQIVYPYWKEGKMITEAEDKKQKPSTKRPDKTTADPPGVTK